MLFVSKYSQNCVGIQSEVKDIVQIDGVLQPRVIKPQLLAQFSEGVMMTVRERQAAVRLMREKWGEHALGAMPDVNEGVLQDGTTRSYSGSDPLVRVSGFRTDDQGLVPEDLRTLYEERLMSPACGFNTDYVLVESGGLSKPWPTYDDLGQGAALSIPKTVRDLGIDATYVMEYELATKNRPGVVEGLRKLILEKSEESLDQANYAVVVK